MKILIFMLSYSPLAPVSRGCATDKALFQSCYLKKIKSEIRSFFIDPRAEF